MTDIKEFVSVASARAQLGLQHISTKPWSDYTAADYTPEQWHAACLIHHHGSGTPDIKTQCKLPVRTPDGTLNRNGMAAAAASLAGGRTELIASPTDKAKAAKALLLLYKQEDIDPPASLLKHSVMLDGEVLEHHGVKGMKWGVRNKRTSKAGASADKPKVKELSDEELKKAVSRMQMERQYNQLTKRNSPHHKALKAGAAFVAGIALNVARNQIQSQATNAVGVMLAKKAAKKAAGG
jgi:hypothetical protein